MRCDNAADKKADGGNPAGDRQLHRTANAVTAGATIGPAGSKAEANTSEQGYKYAQ